MRELTKIDLDFVVRRIPRDIRTLMQNYPSLEGLEIIDEHEIIEEGFCGLAK